MTCSVRNLVWGDLALAAVGAVCSALVHSPDTWAQTRLFPPTGSLGGVGGGRHWSAKGLRPSCLVGNPCRETEAFRLGKAAEGIRYPDRGFGFNELGHCSWGFRAFMDFVAFT